MYRTGHHGHRPWLLATAIIGIGAIALAPEARAQQNDDWEWEADHWNVAEDGEQQERFSDVREDAWYDPAGWFDDDETTAYEYDWDDYDYDEIDDQRRDYDWYRRSIDDRVPGRWYGHARHDRMWHDGVHYGTHYQWDPRRSQWTTDGSWNAGVHEFYTDTYFGSPEYDRRQQARRGMSGSDELANQAKNYMFHGTIADMRRVELRGQGEPHALVRLETRDGRSAVVDLGPQSKIGGLDLDQGDAVTISGRRGTIDDRSVILANRVSMSDTLRFRRSAGTTVGADFDDDWRDARVSDRRSDRRDQRREDRRDERRSDRAIEAGDQPGSIILRGSLVDHRRASLDGGAQHTYLRLNLGADENWIVDIGPRLTVGDLDLDPGARVVVHGMERTIGTRNVVVARRIEVDGKTHVISQFDMPGGGVGADPNPRGVNDPQGQVFRGIVRSIDRVTLGSADADRMVVRLRLDDGSSTLVDLGRNFGMGDMSIEDLRNREILLRGHRRMIGGSSVLVAHQLTLDGKPVPVTTRP